MWAVFIGSGLSPVYLHNYLLLKCDRLLRILWANFYCLQLCQSKYLYSCINMCVRIERIYTVFANLVNECKEAPIDCLTFRMFIPVK